ncbi:MAG TPA: spore maturation protein A [Candidatus Gallacutalibacter pullistercoris]|nr:spore maturation protein A [Candidatus Gallacutalibacter pullistercoris]
MLNKIWAGMILISFLCALATGRMEALSKAVLTGSQRAVELTFSMAGMMCAWTGLLKIAQQGGLTAILARVLRPAVSRLLPGCRPDGEAMQAASLNITANLLGLGNAATPLGIAAMKAMVREAPKREEMPNRAMIRFVVLNTASIQLMPTYIATLRAQYGSAAPFEIAPAVWVVSAAALTAALAMCRLLEGRRLHG